jgi:hypothetical protein
VKQEVPIPEVRAPPGTYYEVYLDLPEGTTPTPASPFFIGNLSFFALKPHHMLRDSPASRAGGKRVFDVTKIVSKLLTGQEWDKANASVTFVPRGLVDREGKPITIPAGQKATVGTISISLSN